MHRCLQAVVTHRCLQATSTFRTTAFQSDSNRTCVVRFGRQKYERMYPVLLVRPDGSTINIRYKEPKRIMKVSGLYPRPFPKSSSKNENPAVKIMLLCCYFSVEYKMIISLEELFIMKSSFKKGTWGVCFESVIIDSFYSFARCLWTSPPSLRRRGKSGCGKENRRGQPNRNWRILRMISKLMITANSGRRNEWTDIVECHVKSIYDVSHVQNYSFVL